MKLGRSKANASRAAVLAVLGLCLGIASTSDAQNWPDIFDPGQLLTLNLTIDPADWATIQGDSSFSIEVPAQFWLAGEAPILISVRRKSDPELTAAAGFDKVSLSLDINDLVAGQTWHDLKKLSLENGGDSNVLSEGFAWQVVELAGTTQGFGYRAGYASWVKLIINGVDTGVYVSAEKRDKRLLENRNLYVDGFTWLYEVEDQSGGLILQVGGPQDSPTVEELCYSPFDLRSPCAPPPDLGTELPLWVHMPGLLTELAVDAFTGNGDALLTAGKNFYFADSTYPAAPLRLYFPWDLDGAKFNKQSETWSIYSPPSTSAYASLLTEPAIRAQYSQIYNDLICGPWSDASLSDRLDVIEPVITAALAADPNHDGGSISGLRSWVPARIANVTGQIEGFQPCPTVQLQVNEVMASNGVFLEDPAEPGEYPDWFELYNPALVPVDVDGIYVSDTALDPTKYQIPAGVTIPAQGFLLMYADDDGTQGPEHTNFKLAGVTGESVIVTDRDGVTQLDIVTFGPQTTDVAHGRYPDGVGTWDFMPLPTPGQANQPHNPPPALSQTSRDIEVPSNAEFVIVTTSASDDSAVASVTLHYDAVAGEVLVPMLDDGNSGDGAAGDGVYGGPIPAFPNRTIVRYWIDAVDDLGASSVDPLPAPVGTFTYVVSYIPPPLIVNEFMADNDNVIEDPDEPLAYEDWLELYNGGAADVSLDGMYMTDNLFFPTKFALPDGLVVPGNGHLLLWADGEPAQGIEHLGFQLSAIGEEVGIADTDQFGNVVVSSFVFGPQVMDQGEGRCPDGHALAVPLTTPSPGTANLGLPGCLVGSDLVFWGIASGGYIDVTVEGVTVGITTFPGDTLVDIPMLLRDEIDADPTLGGMGVVGSAVGQRLIVNGEITDLSNTDPTISVPEPALLWQWLAGGALLSLLAWRKLPREPV